MADELIINQPVTGIVGIIGKPERRAAESKAVPPGVHVAHESLAPDAGDFVGEQHLQVADGGLFQVVAAGVTVQFGATIGTHANRVTGLVQHGVQRRIAAREDTVPDDAGLLVTPVTAGDRLAVSLHDEFEAKALQQGRDRLGRKIGQAQNFGRVVLQLAITMRPA